MSAVIYKAREGARINDKDAALIGQTVRRVTRKRGVTAEELVNIAAPEESPIHDYFEWDDARAAHEYRLEQGRDYLRSIEVVKQTDKGEMTTRAFHVVTNGDQRYMPEEVVWTTPDYSAQVVERARRELQGWTDRYAQYEELSPVREAVVEALAA